jgi:hypothetical protein
MHILDAAILFWLEGVALTTVAVLGIVGNAIRLGVGALYL